MVQVHEDYNYIHIVCRAGKNVQHIQPVQLPPYPGDSIMAILH